MVLNKDMLWRSCTELQEEESLMRLYATPFLELCDQISAMTRLLGPALKFAAKYMDTLLARTRQHVNEFTRVTEVYYPHLGPSLVAMLHITPAETMHEPGSIRHCISRLIWMLDFTEALVTNLVSDKFAGKSVQACAAAAYEDRLACNHKWFIQKAVRLALYACPSRERLYADVSFAELTQLQTLLQKPVAYCYHVLQQEGLTLALQ